MRVKRSTILNNMQPQDHAVIFCMYYLICITVLDYALSGALIVSFSSYLSILIELSVTVYLVYCNGWKLKVNTCGIISIAILSSCLLFTMMHAGVKNSVFALFKEYNIVFVCVVLASFKYEKEVVGRILKIFIVFGVSALIFSVVFENFFTQVTHASNAYTVTIESFFGNKNQFGRILYLSAVSAFIYYVSVPCKKMYLLVTILLSVATVFSFSRTSLVALLAFYGVCFLLKSKMSIFKRLLILLGIIIILAAIFSSESAVEYMNKIIIRKDADLSSRTVLWSIGLEYVHNHPLIGAGEYMAENIIHAKGMLLSEFHSEYIYRLVSSGIPVTALYIFLINDQMRSLLKQRKRNPYAILCVSGVISFMVYMCFEQCSIYRFSIEGMLLATFLCIVPNIKYGVDERTI